MNTTADTKQLNSMNKRIRILGLLSDLIMAIFKDEKSQAFDLINKITELVKKDK